jgi:ketosteroid isomerase-like protein
MSTSKEVAMESDLAVRWILARYCQLVDDRDFDAAAALFADTARFRIVDQELEGRAAIREWFDTVPDPTFHHVSNIVVSNGSKPEVLHAVSDLTSGGKGDSGWSVWILGRYHDTMAGHGRDIRFTQRILTIR